MSPNIARIVRAVVAAITLTGLSACGEKVRNADYYITHRDELASVTAACERDGFTEADARNPVTDFQRRCFNAGVALVRIRASERDAARRAARQRDADSFSGAR